MKATRITISLYDCAGDSAETAKLAFDRAGAALIKDAARLLGLPVLRTDAIPRDTKLFSGRVEGDNNSTFALLTLKEVEERFGAEAASALAANDLFHVEREGFYATIELAART